MLNCVPLTDLQCRGRRRAFERNTCHSSIRVQQRLEGFEASGRSFVLSYLVEQGTLVCTNFIFLFIRVCSKFADIYDEEHFISTLEGYVKVVQELPEEIMEKYDYNMTNIPNFRVEAWASVSYYTGVVYPVLRNQGYVSNCRIHGFDFEHVK